jgi:hypothetical protein
MYAENALIYEITFLKDAQKIFIDNLTKQNKIFLHKKLLITLYAIYYYHYLYY